MKTVIGKISTVLTRGLLLYCAHTENNGKEGWGLGTTRYLEPGAASSFPATFKPRQAAQSVDRLTKTENGLSCHG